MEYSLLLNGQKLKKVYAMMFRSIIKAYHLTKNEIDVLLFLANNQNFNTATDIVELRSLSKSQVCKSIESLVQRGYLVPTQDKLDKRCIHLSLDPNAMPVVVEAQAKQYEFLQLLCSGITPEEQIVMNRIFKQISDNIEGALKHDD